MENVNINENRIINKDVLKTEIEKKETWPGEKEKFLKDGQWIFKFCTDKAISIDVFDESYETRFKSKVKKKIEKDSIDTLTNKTLTSPVINTATNEGFYFRAGDIVRNAVTGEAMLVTTGNAASSFTCTRGIGTS